MIRNFHGPWRIQPAAAIGFKIRCATFLLQDPVVNAATRRYATSTVAPKRNGLRTPAATTVTESTVLAIQATARCAANHRHYGIYLQRYQNTILTSTMIDISRFGPI